MTNTVQRVLARRSAVLVAIASGSLCGCSTTVSLLEQERDQLRRIETAAVETAGLAGAQHFDPARYDFHLLVNASVFDQVLSKFDDTMVTLDASGRPVEFTLGSLRLAFRPGYPDVSLSARARDVQTGLTADVVLDGSLVVEADPQAPGELYLRLVATRVVPDLSWKIFQLSHWRFARRIAQLEVTRLTEQIPAVQIPLEQTFSLGGPAQTTVLNMPTGEGSMTGNMTTPATGFQGQIAVRRILFLQNGVHIFADVEGA